MSLPRLRPKWVPVVRCTTCDQAYVLELAYPLDGRPPRYIFRRDCKHKTPPLGKRELADIETAIVDAFARKPEVAS